MNHLLNSGTVSEVEAKLKKATSRKDIRLALQNERESKKPRVTVIRMLIRSFGSVIF